MVDVKAIAKDAEVAKAAPLQRACQASYRMRHYMLRQRDTDDETSKLGQLQDEIDGLIRRLSGAAADATVCGMTGRFGAVQRSL